MTTAAEFTNFVLKRVLTSEDFKERLLEFLRADIAAVTQAVYDSDGTFGPTAATIDPIGGGVDLMDFEQSPDSDFKGTDGLGNLLSLGVTGSEDAGAGQIKTGVQFENTAALSYWWSLQEATRAKGVQINPRTGLPEYATLQSAIGVSADPDSVVDNGGSVTLVIDSACESGHSHANRLALVYLKVPSKGAITEAIAIEQVQVTWNGVNNRITTTATLGQTTVSTTASDYTVVLLGPTVRKFDTSAISGHWFLGVVLGSGAGANNGDVTAQTVINQSLVSLLNYTGGPAWADGVTNPATTIDSQLTKIITDLTSTSGARGLGKLTSAARAAWHDATTNPAANSDAALAKIITDLVNAAGADRIGAAAGGNLTAGSVQDQLGELDTEKGGLALANLWALLNNFNLGISVGNGVNTTAADAESARISSTIVDTGTAPRTLLWAITDPATGEVMRMYASSGGGAAAGPALEITVNAVWDAGSWDKDAVGVAGIVSIAREGIVAQQRETTAVATWADSSAGWDGGKFQMQFNNLGITGLWENPRVIFDNVGTQSNPAVTTAPIANTIYAINLMKAWGHLFSASTTVTIDDGFNFDTAVYSAGDIVVTYHTAMGGLNRYAPIAQISGSAAGGDKQMIEVFNATATGFSLRLLTETLDVGGNLDVKFTQLSLDGANVEIGFQVAGTQT